MRVNNEYKIVLSQPKGGNWEVVLGKADNKKYGTWLCVNGKDYYWGNYFDNLKDALFDFIKKAGLKLDIETIKEKVDEIKKSEEEK